MRNQSLLILFFFGLVIKSTYSIIPMKEKHELPIININGNKKNVNIKQDTYIIEKDRFFLFDLKDLYQASKGIYENYLFFQLNSTALKLDISYTTVDTKMSLIHPIDSKNTYKYFSPNITLRQSSGKKMSNIIAVYAKKADRKKQTLIIRVNNILLRDNLIISPLAEPPNALISQLNTIIKTHKTSQTERGKPKSELKGLRENYLKRIEQKRKEHDHPKTTEHLEHPKPHEHPEPPKPHEHPEPPKPHEHPEHSKPHEHPQHPKPHEHPVPPKPHEHPKHPKHPEPEKYPKHPKHPEPHKHPDRHNLPKPPRPVPHHERHRRGRDRIFGFTLGIGILLWFVWLFIIINYILVNRRKKSFISTFKNPVVASNYQNV